VENESIPECWRKPVCNILRHGDAACIEWTIQAFLDWRAATLSQFRYEAYDAMADYLSRPMPVGKGINLPEEGETFAFFFQFNAHTLYAKICLRPSKSQIKIVSLHTPRRGDRLF
jgi:hypothetical protein